MGEFILSNLGAMALGRPAEQIEDLREIRQHADGRFSGLGPIVPWRQNEKRMVEVMTGPAVFARAFMRCADNGMLGSGTRVIKEICNCTGLNSTSCGNCLFTRS